VASTSYHRSVGTFTDRTIDKKWPMINRFSIKRATKRKNVWLHILSMKESASSKMNNRHHRLLLNSDRTRSSFKEQKGRSRGVSEETRR